MKIGRLFRPRVLLPAAAGILLLHFAWMSFRVGRGLTREALEVPTIVYGRPAAVRIGDAVGNVRLEERLRRLGYRKVSGVPDRPGSYAQDGRLLHLYTREARYDGQEHRETRVDVEVRDGRVASLALPSGVPVETLRLEPEEIARLLGPKREARRPVSLAAIPKPLRYAVLAAEDARFYSHFGIDLIGIGRALVANIRAGRFVQGASTITQQLARNTFLTPKKSLWRKFREAEIAVLIELRNSKPEILEAYLNKIYFGQDGPNAIHGVDEASRFYFSKGVGELSLEESALLAGIIRSPSLYSPLRMPAAAKERRNWVLARMARYGWIAEAERERASRAPVRLHPRRAQVRFAEYFVDYVERRAEEIFGGEKVYRADHRIVTSLDAFQQAAAEAAVREGLAALDRGRGGGENGGGLQAALVAVDPRTGEITAMVGGSSYGETQFNRAADARRQPGSAFKPFVLLAAMEETVNGKSKTTLASPVSGAPLTVETPQGPWSPANFEKKTYGTITVRRAVEDSVNTAFVRLAQDTGLKTVADAARRAGIESALSPVPSMALGTFEVTPVELALAYATLANGGRRVASLPIRDILGPGGDLLYAGKVEQEDAFDPRAAYLVTAALEGVLDRGTGVSARQAGFTLRAAGKTGTTDGNRDSWFVGYTPDLVCAVWVGRDNGGDTGLTGAQGALRIWTRFMRAVYPAAGPPEFAAPPGIVTAEIDPESGYLATSACPVRFTEVFLDGTVPKETCPLHPSRPLVDTIRKGLRGIGDLFRSLFR